MAEIGAAFLCEYAGFCGSTLQNSAAYIDSWRRRLGREPAWVVSASAAAAQASDFVRGLHPAALFPRLRAEVDALYARPDEPLECAS